MLFQNAWICLLLALPSAAFAATQAPAPGPAVIGIRQNETATERFARDSGLDVVPSTTREFDSGITLVQLQKSIARRDVIVVIPAKMDANQFMEALLKIRTAKTTGAVRVSVVSPVPLDQVNVQKTADGETIPLPVEELISVAGADLVRDGPTARAPKPPVNPARGSALTGKKVFISGPSDWSLVQGLREKSGLPLLEAGDSARVKGATIMLVQKMTRPGNDSLLSAISRAHQLKEQGAAFVDALFPYLPYARLDRTEHHGFSTVGGSLAADLIENSGVDATSFVRAHAPQSQGFFKSRSRQFTGRPTINAYLKQQWVQVVIAPDAGAQKDDTLYADELGVPISVINKQRDPKTKQATIRGVSGASLKGKIAVIIDDETESGSTLAKAAKLARKRGASKVIVFVTHLAGPAKAALDSEDIDQIVVTDSFPIPNPHPKLKVLSLADEIAREWLQPLHRMRTPSLRCFIGQLNSLPTPH